MSVDAVFHGINIACGAFNTFRSTKKLLSDGQVPLSLRIADFAVQCFGVGCDIYEVDLLAHHASATTLMRLKEVELLDKVIAIPVRCTAEMMRTMQRGEFSFGLFVSCIEKATLSTVADVIRVACEVDTYDAKHYLEMTPEELAKHPKPIYVNRGSARDPVWEIDHYEQRTKEDCQKDMDQAEHIANIASGIRLVADTHMVSISLKTAYYALIVLLQRNAPRVEQVLQVPVAVHAVAHNEVAPAATALIVQEEDPLQLIDPFDLVHQKSIPEMIARIDPFFQDYLCSISYAPMRDPVQDPTGGTHLYDRIWILRALKQNKKSPMTNLPLYPNQLIPRADLKALIDARLLMHQERITMIMEQQPELFMPSQTTSSSNSVAVTSV